MLYSPSQYSQVFKLGKYSTQPEMLYLLTVSTLGFVQLSLSQSFIPPVMITYSSNCILQPALNECTLIIKSLKEEYFRYLQIWNIHRRFVIIICCSYYSRITLDSNQLSTFAIFNDQKLISVFTIVQLMKSQGRVDSECV